MCVGVCLVLGVVCRGVCVVCSGVCVVFSVVCKGVCVLCVVCRGV